MRKLFAQIMTAAIASATAMTANAADWAIAIPDAYPNGPKALEAPLWEIFANVIKPGDRYRVLNATDVSSIALIDVPSDDRFERKQRLARHFQGENAKIYEHLQGMALGPAEVELTGLVRFEAINRTDGAEPLALLVIGDMAQIIKTSPSFSMRDEDGGFRKPSDRHYQSALDETFWGIGAEGPQGLQNVALHLCHTGASTPLSEVEEEALRRHWALYVSERDGVLATWSQDLPTCLGLSGISCAGHEDGKKGPIPWRDARGLSLLTSFWTSCWLAETSQRFLTRAACSTI